MARIRGRVGGHASPLTMNRFECDQCGACCNGSLIVETDEIDLMREPRLIEAEPSLKGYSVPQVLEKYENETGFAILLACSSDRPCPFLVGKKCSIYPTRPNVCVAMQAGDEQCQEARKATGLEPLAPIQQNVIP